MSIAKPIIVPFDTVDANEYFYIEYTGDPSLTNNNRFTRWKYVIKNLDTGTQVEGDYRTIQYVENTSVDDYFYNKYMNPPLTTIPIGVWTPTTKNYYIAFPKNYTHNNQTVFENGHRYAIAVDFSTGTQNVVTTLHPFWCYADFVVALESYQYNSGEETQITQTNTSDSYELTMVQPVCKLNFSYTQEDGEGLKYYQFFLYNEQDKLLGATKKIYGISDDGITYTMENHNNLQSYILKLCCVTHANRSSITTVNIHTDYNVESIYANIIFSDDNQNAENIISFNVIELNGTGETYEYDNTNDSVIIQDGGYVNFIDTYQTINKNFLCRLWCKDLSVNKPVFKIQTSNINHYIEVFFTGLDFRAYKHSYGLSSGFCSKIIKNEDNLTTTFVTNTQELEGKEIYFAIGYYDGRIKMYAKIIENEVTV